MITLLFSWCASILLLILEFCFGNWGFFVPFSAACVLYFAMTTSWKNALALALVTGLVLDGIYARSIPLATCLLATALLFNRRLLPETIRDHGMLSALCSGLLYAILLEMVLFFCDGDAATFWQKIWAMPLVILTRTAGFCLFVYLFDALAVRIGALPYCVELNENAPHYHGGRKVSQQTIAPERGDR